MATWKSKTIKVNVEVVKDGWLNYEPREFSWEYGTVSDYLKCYENGEDILFQDYERSRILWFLLDDWANRYLGEDEMNQIREEYRKTIAHDRGPDKETNRKKP